MHNRALYPPPLAGKASDAKRDPDAALIREWVMTAEGMAARKGKGQHSTEMLRFVTREGKVVELTAGKANVVANNLVSGPKKQAAKKAQETAKKQAAKGAVGQGL